MSIYLFAFFVSFIVNFILIIPFINLLYKLKFQRAHQKTRDAFNQRTPIFDKFHKMKAGTPVGGGILIVTTTLLGFVIFGLVIIAAGRNIVTNYQSIVSEIKILLFTFFTFSLLGLYDDLKKIFFWRDSSFFGLRLRYKLIIEIVLALIVSFWMYKDLHIKIVNIPYVNVLDLSWMFIPFATFVIVSFANAVNITDGLDGLSSGLLLIALLSFWIISVSILDTPLLVFISIWIGGLVAFLYFNIYPARIFLGDTGSLAFGATLAVIGLLLGKIFTLVIVGGVFIIEILSSFLQLTSKRLRKAKIFPAAPFHLWLQYRGWEEPKIVMRAWIFGVLFALLGLMISFLK
ncbi:phospho-N-acetylmuramoyl-pentapeptide-transferase [Candidatus Roizmanbacteria bacterium RIFCSPLOWO2_01_FULL_38_11]|uniref:Phospho-N-acetylmuramoyl-pentapeptide-transferase n=1 Tax=Candidatus Roizmanbacteria bacterium RIFCSPLOWO2_01_FULL_38_11 TaxID=1802060 RepID=A0A1F7INF4_9BACT|nr:MAG: phospho-N-acetylmuramoyl-pentapeptide-transferase [Candidatus Roizmanbacteria bacterium RIFCSPLOWO2_01_FULL_38_11]